MRSQIILQFLPPSNEIHRQYQLKSIQQNSSCGMWGRWRLHRHMRWHTTGLLWRWGRSPHMWRQNTCSGRRRRHPQHSGGWRRCLPYHTRRWRRWRHAVWRPELHGRRNGRWMKILARWWLSRPRWWRRHLNWRGKLPDRWRRWTN